MTAADIQTGTPKIEARYVVFIQCDAVAARDWVEPVIMTWAGGRWHTSFLKSKIIGWLGPIPVMKVKDIQVEAPAVIEEKRGEETQYPDDVPPAYDL